MHSIPLLFFIVFCTWATFDARRVRQYMKVGYIAFIAVDVVGTVRLTFVVGGEG